MGATIRGFPGLLQSRISDCNPNTDTRIGKLPNSFPCVRNEADSMKTLSVFMSFALLAGANGLAARLRSTGSLPGHSSKPGTVSHARTNVTAAYAKAPALNRPATNNH
jgi:hypothetical protein